ncbi:endonuclease NucS [Nanoarchaeota archaeon]
MEFNKFSDTIQEAIARNETVVFGCNCEVVYSGRAESFLPVGDRVVIIKADNTLLIHQPKGNTPINYMKEGCSFDLEINKDHILFKTKNLGLKEYLDLKIKEIHFLNTHPLEDDQKIQLAGSEKDMADMIFNDPNLIEDGFKPLTREEHTKYGFIDVFGYDKDNALVVIECKRFQGDLKAVSQLRRYVEKIKKAKGLDKVRGILVAPKISKNTEKMLNDFGFEFRAINPPKYLERHDKKQRKLDGF